MTVDPARLERARAAHAGGDVDTAYHELRAAGSTDELSVEDLALAADAAWWMGRSAESLSLYESVFRRRLDMGDEEGAARVAVDIGFLWMLRGEQAIGSGWVSRARRLAAALPAGETAGILSYLDASIALEVGDLEAAFAGAETLLQLGGTLGLPVLSSLGTLCEGRATIRAGDLAAGLALLDEAMLPVIAGEVPRDWAGNIYCTIIDVCHGLADVPRARQWTEATTRWCGQFSSAVMFVGICRAHRVQLLSTAGAWDEAKQEADRARVELADLNVGVVAECDYQLGELHRLRGEIAAAREAYARARSRGREPQPGEALLDLAEGRPERAWTAVNAALVTGADDRRAEVLLAKTEIGLAVGRRREAEQTAAALEEVRRHYPTPGHVAWSEHARGAVLVAQQRHAPARATLRAALDAYAALPDPYGCARVRLLLARVLRADGEAAAATGQEDCAYTTLSELQAVVPGLRGRPGGLTDRELQVLDHVARGETNQEVAASLVISEATVRRHLANVFTKLGVATRTAAAAWARDEGLVGR